ncbi:TIGR04255 family protein [Anabaena cylindrica FACHB-243]|uniref:TIGR04255 family protein n=1 Tax=Anabaena cylindrica (strain ATCC 27899 / PCC 7122) TaxID=272123 RepID=K9ZPB5_ANACC|nr:MULTISPECIES: TIGR04255 family protein [Anabaena]AFZ60377.1 hypothetical protein Anacy_5037 [Anabaena cylindrica PCC 7122]MBD2418900.1 TIGR04255 family protein [Anabaena cylindrica FACHB-243]MBY5284878.1 TIGR04255 family protein [Anabaena sp. CCAP 1446/1C]MBY5309485.1 TIGR04255 family protein [Anabaena sp. CCAP 1446/1C]MCM2404489.1 TIGR04255 family protein [Anabaena sp. CCAP 1446/1C]
MASVRFTRPPLDEIIFSVEFVAPGFSSVHFGLYWESIRLDFPVQQDKRPIILEENENSTPLLQRVWFISNDGKKLIQLQDNLFIFNWRYDQQNKNPAFEDILKEFIYHWNHLKAWWLNIAQESIELRNYGLTYINQIGKKLGWENAKDYSKIFNFGTTEGTDLLNFPVSLDFKISFLLPDNSGTLLIRLEQLSRSDNYSEEVISDDELFLFFQLLTKSSNTTIPIIDWFTSAHDYVVTAFLELTKDEAQKSWGRYEY